MLKNFLLLMSFCFVGHKIEALCCFRKKTRRLHQPELRPLPLAAVPENDRILQKVIGLITTSKLCISTREVEDLVYQLDDENYKNFIEFTNPGILFWDETEFKNSLASAAQLTAPLLGIVADYIFESGKLTGASSGWSEKGAISPRTDSHKRHWYCTISIFDSNDNKHVIASKGSRVVHENVQSIRFIEYSDAQEASHFADYYIDKYVGFAQEGAEDRELEKLQKLHKLSDDAIARARKGEHLKVPLLGEGKRFLAKVDAISKKLQLAHSDLALFAAQHNACIGRAHALRHNLG